MTMKEIIITNTEMSLDGNNEDKMKPTLEDILYATVDEVLYEDRKLWELHKNSRLSEIILIKQLYCYVANEIGYQPKEIGHLIRKRESTVLKYVEEIKRRAGAKALMDSRIKFSKWK